MLLERDDNGNILMVGTTFLTEAKTLGGTSFEEIEVKGVEVTLKSSAEFTIGESSEATGFVVAEEITIGTARMSNLYIKGVTDQSINILWVK